ncbi:GyrI-like domain-containing protein [Leucobacter allii]|uniref:GyrI-like domain-containing protein n=1 Tax=Leucobacter allii TaxID=2932247 RepID=A0ABY4FQF2_9MICO|nr:GyrI-like domain-containing protein [Leucobacter allii]UOQ58519.1 GyrI-like domain-containing protein [Leucobacter allii]
MDEAYRIEDPAIVEFSDIHLAVVRETVGFAEIPGLYDRAYPMLFSTLAAAGTAPAAAPMGVVHGGAGEALDLSVAVPLATGYVAGPGAPAEVTAETIPGGRAARLLVRGDYSGIAAGYERLHAWLAELGETPDGLAWEQYLTEPEPGGDPAGNETLIAVRLRDPDGAAVSGAVPR